MKKRGLGRRLEELLAGSNKAVGVDSVSKTSEMLSAAMSSPVEKTNEIISNEPSVSSKPNTTSSIGGVELRQVAIDKIQPGRYQPRKVFHDEALQELAESIKSQGVIQPIILRPLGSNLELIAGERRWRAAQLAGLTSIPAIVQEITDETAIAMALIENLQREDLNPIEEAYALQRLIDEFGLSHLEVAETIGRSRAAVTNMLRLLKLNSDVRLMLEEGQIDAGHAKVLLALEGYQQSDAAKIIASRHLSVRESESLIKQLQRPKEKTPEIIDPNVRSLQKMLSEKLGAKVTIKSNKQGKGVLTIQYHSNDELQGILDRIR